MFPPRYQTSGGSSGNMCVCEYKSKVQAQKYDKF